jgi:adenylate cyclase
VHTGEVVVGNIGSTKRAKYGLVDSPVNLTSRIESYTVGGQVLVSHTTIAELPDQVITGESFRVTPKGIHAPLTIHEVLAIRGKYNVELAQREIELQQLTSPLAIELALVDGKDVGGTRIPASIFALALEAAEIEVISEMAPRTNVKITLLAAGAPHSDAIYAKVMKPTSKGRVSIRFTALPPRSRQWIKALLAH